jgi:hypothetical protein
MEQPKGLCRPFEKAARLRRIDRPRWRLLALALVAACGEAPPTGTASPAEGDATLPPGLQRISFTGVADPATGRLQIFMGPQAAIGLIPEDADGNAATVTADNAQLYAPSVSYVANGGTGYPPACTAPLVMVANVEVFSGFKEQLRNVYARITDKSTGPTFCTVATPGTIAPPAGSYSGLYLYEPLNNGTAPSAIRRTVQWSLNLLDMSAFWFSGDLWAEVIPQPPTPNSPANGSTVHTGGATSARFRTTWTDDPRADGSSTGDAYSVARPTGGASLTIRRCGPATTTNTFDGTQCLTTIFGPNLRANGQSPRMTFSAGSWYQVSLQTSFLLPGGATRILGSTVTSWNFRVLNP